MASPGTPAGGAIELTGLQLLSRRGVSIFPDPGSAPPPSPVVFTPVIAGATSVSGFCDAPNGSTITLRIGLLTYTTAVTSKAWTKTGLSALDPSQFVTTTVTTSGTGLTSEASYPVVVLHKAPSIDTPVLQTDIDVSGTLLPTSDEPVGTFVELFKNGGSAGSDTTDGAGAWSVATTLSPSDTLTAYAGGLEYELRTGAMFSMLQNVDGVRVAHIGGFNAAAAVALGNVDLFTNRLGGFLQPLDPLPSSSLRYDSATCVLGDYLYVFGGNNTAGDSTTSAYRLNLTTGAWTTLTAMPYFSTESYAIPFGADKILVIAGVIGNSANNTDYSKYVMTYNVTSATWSTATPTLAADQAGGANDSDWYMASCCRLYSDEILVIGGQANENCFVVDMMSKSITATANTPGSLANLRYAPAILLENGDVLVAGGMDGTTELSACYIYDRASNSFTAVASMNAARANHAAIRLDDGRVFVVGGEDNGALLASCEIYDRALNTWTTKDAVNYGWENLPNSKSIALLDDGNVLIAGGYDDLSTPASMKHLQIYDVAGNTWANASGSAKSGGSTAVTAGLAPEMKHPPHQNWAYGRKAL